jgi:hypothetical protein
VPSGDQAENSPRIEEKREGLRANGKDSAIEFCFQLLSSGRSLDEILAELGSKPAGGEHGNPDGLADALEESTDPGLTELLIKRAKANLPLPARHGEVERRRAAAAAAADWATSSGGDRAIAAARAADNRLPAVHSEIASWEQPTDDRGVDPAPLATTGWRRIARLIGALLVFAALIAAAPSVTYELLRVTHGAASGHSGAPEADKPPVARRNAQIPARVSHDAHNPASAITVAEKKPPAPRPSTAAARPSPPVEPARVQAPRRIPAPPIMATAAHSIAAAPLAAVAAAPRASALAIASAKPPLHPAITRNALSAATAKVKTDPAVPRLSASEIAALVARGDALFAAGDVTNARLFYRRGADGGNGPAALRLGESFDPAFLAQAGLRQIPGDAKQAAYWYRRAHDLGVRGAALLLQSLKPAEQQ